MISILCNEYDFKSFKQESERKVDKDIQTRRTQEYIKYSWEASHVSERGRENKTKRRKWEVREEGLRKDPWCEKLRRTNK